MSSLRIALVACANGLGHVRRMLALSIALRERGASPVLFVPKSAAHQFATNWGLALPEVVDFQSRTTRADWMSPDTRCWTDDLPSLKEFDEVVSDNLVEILGMRPHAWLSGSFFWHLTLPNFPPHKAIRAEELLTQHRPRMIATRLFAAPYLGAKTRLNTVGMYTLGQVVRTNKTHDILISCGKGGEAQAETGMLIEHIASGAQPGSCTVWVEPALYSNKMPDWIRPAIFTPAMYAQVAAAVIRPGVGTATDALLVGARLFMFYEFDNLEMTYNAQRIAELRLGKSFSSAKDAWWAALDFVRTRDARLEHAAYVQRLGFRGADEAASILLRTKKASESTTYL